MAFALLRYLAFLAVAIVGPGVALQRLLGLATDAAIVLPLGAAFTALAYAVASASGLPWLFPAAVLLVDAVLLWRGLGPRADGPHLRGAVPACVALVVFLAISQYGWNLGDATGAFLLDPMGDHPLHVGATFELTLPWPPQVPGLAGIPLVYHLGADLVRAAALQWAAVSPYDQVSRFEVTLWAVALVLALRGVTARLGAPPLAVSLVGWAPLAGDLVFLLAPFLPLAWWGDLLRGNLLMSVLFDNPVVLGLAMALGVPLALARHESGEGRGWVAVAGALAIAAAYVKVFLGAQLVLGLLWAARTRGRRGAPLLLAALTAAAVATLAGGSGGERVEVALLPLDLVKNSVAGLGLDKPSGLRLALWLLPWLALSLGLRIIGLPPAFSALRRAQSLPAILAAIAISGWPLGLLFHAAARDVSGLPLPSALIYFVEQSGCVLWIFTAIALAARAPGRRVLVVGVAALACLPSAVEMAWQRRHVEPDRISPALMGAMRAVEQASHPGDVVLQRPGFERPPLPVVLIGRRVLLEGYTPYLTQFAPVAELRRRRQDLVDLFRAESSEDARRRARALGGAVLVLYDDQSVPFDPGDWLRLVYDHKEARVYRIE
jgi:hypothetical protein